MNLSNNLKIAIQAAIEAGEEILKIYNEDNFEVDFKEDNSPLTSADKASHLKIISFLKNTSFPVLSEEGRDIASARIPQVEVLIVSGVPSQSLENRISSSLPSAKLLDVSKRNLAEGFVVRSIGGVINQAMVLASPDE